MATASDLYNQALAHAKAGRFAAALGRADAVLRLAPAEARAHGLRGDVLQALGRVAESLASYDRAIRLRPDYAVALANRGGALAKLSRPQEALASLDQAIACNPQLAAAHANRARVLNDLRRHDAAIEGAERALALAPGYAAAMMHRGAALYGLRRYGEALESYEAAARAAPEDYEALSNLGMACTAAGRYPEALAALDAAVARDPAAPLAYYRRAHVRLLTLDFAGGWRDYEARWRTDLFVETSAGYVTPSVRPLLTPDPTAADIAGRSVLLIAEQGVGDQIMFASLIPELLRAARSASLVCDPRLAGLFAQSFPMLTLAGPGLDVAASGAESVIALGSLAGLYRNRLEDFPGRPYLAPRPETAQAWRRRLGPRRGRLRIGLSWRGGTATTGAEERSIPLAALRPLLDLADCEFVSLQYGDCAAELAGVNATLAQGVRAFPAEDIDDFEQLAGLVAALDLVVTVQTSVAHLSGALGRPCLVMVPKRPEWRYTASQATMPWYGSVQIVRQAPDEDWAPVVARAACLARAAADPLAAPEFLA